MCWVSGEIRIAVSCILKGVSIELVLHFHKVGHSKDNIFYSYQSSRDILTLLFVKLQKHMILHFPQYNSVFIFHKQRQQPRLEIEADAEVL